jgi:hypothetical protein
MTNFNFAIKNSVLRNNSITVILYNKKQLFKVCCAPPVSIQGAPRPLSVAASLGLKQ